LWNGSFSDSTVITPAFLLTEAQKYLQPGVINLGHANHPAVLSVFDQLMDLIHSRALHPATLDKMFATSRRTGTA
jgi:peptidoglycan-N-acetylglucosamine deacetylase